MAMNRFTWFGLALAILGWVVLIGDAMVSPFGASGGNLASTMALRSDIFTVAQTMIFSGFALALLGALRAGFGALSKFFDAVLERSSNPRPAPPPPVVTPMETPAVHVMPREIDPIEPVERPVQATAPAKQRNYIILENGAVEVQTLLGTRVFASLDEARDYIR